MSPLTLHKCSLCEFQTTLTGLLYRHLLIHTESKPFFCEQCDRRFSLPESLLWHLRNHSLTKPFMCNKCGEFMRSETQLRRHLVVHISETMHRCLHCGKGFLSHHDVNQHMASRKFINQRGVLMYLYSDFSPKNCSPLRSARFITHMKHRWKLLPEGCIGPIVEVVKPPFFVRCVNKKYFRLFDFKDKIKPNERAFPPEEENIIGVSVGSSSDPNPCDYIKKPKRETTATIRKVHKCHICNKQFKLLFLLQAHLNIHTGRKPFMCSKCNIQFYTADHYRSHKWMHNNPGQIPNQCRICQRRYATLAELRAHKLSHAGTRKYTRRSNVLDNEMTTIDKVEQQMWLNSKNAVFECGVCGTKHDSFDLLRKHLQSCANLGKSINYKRDLEIEIVT